MISLIISCGESNYILEETSPPIDVGFFGFRWSTPMSIVDEEFPKQTGAQPESGLNTYNTSYFKDAYFLGAISSLSKFAFNEAGLSSIEINFNTNYQSIEKIFDPMLDKLIDIYGEPIEHLITTEFPEIPEYILKYSWDESRLELVLNTDYSFVINAYSYSRRLIFNGNN